MENTEIIDRPFHRALDLGNNNSFPQTIEHSSSCTDIMTPCVCVLPSPNKISAVFQEPPGILSFTASAVHNERRKRSDSGARNISACSNKRGADITLWRILTTEVKAQYFSSDSMTIMVIWPPRNVRNEMKRSTE